MYLVLYDYTTAWLPMLIAEGASKLSSEVRTCVQVYSYYTEAYTEIK